METIRKLAKSMDQPARMPAVDDKAGAPEKVGGPQHAAFSKEEIHAASLLHSASGDGSAPERARRMAALQRRMGNARLTRLLGELGVQQESGVEPEQIPKRE